jgi:Fic family protein
VSRDETPRDVDLVDYHAGTNVEQYQFRAFVPSTVNHGWTWCDARISLLLEEASQALAELNAFSLIVPDIDLFLSLHVAKEASDSSRIEGTQTELGEVVRPVEDIEPARRGDWQEVRNYVDAMNEAIAALESLPLSNRLLRSAQRTLLRGVGGQHKRPG